MFDTALPPLKEKLGILQRTLRDRNIPTIILIEGWNAAGITMSTHEIIQSLDPRGFTLHATDKPTEDERAHPFLWRFWVKTPDSGRIAIFARTGAAGLLAEKFSTFAEKMLKEIFYKLFRSSCQTVG